MRPSIVILQPETGKAGHYPEVSPRRMDGTGSYGRKPQETVTALFIPATCPHGLIRQSAPEMGTSAPRPQVNQAC